MNYIILYLNIKNIFVFTLINTIIYFNTNLKEYLKSKIQN